MKEKTRMLSVGELETNTKTLDLQILKLERRGWHMTPEEQHRAVELKKMRLAVKDRLSDLRHRMSS